jgi:hypothetical protein
VIALQAVGERGEKPACVRIGGERRGEVGRNVDLAGGVGDAQGDVDGVSALEAGLLPDGCADAVMCLPPMTATVLRYS